MEKHIAYMTSKIELSDCSNIMEISNFYRNTYQDLGENALSIGIKLIEKMIKFGKKKEMKSLIDLIIDDSVNSLKSENLIFVCHAYILTNNYNFSFEENKIFYENHIKKTNFHKKSGFYIKSIFVNIAISYRNLEEYDSAIETLRKNNQTRIELAYNYELKGDYKNAINIYKKIIKQEEDPNVITHAKFNLFTIYDKTNKTSEAKELLNHLEEECYLVSNPKYKVTRSLHLYEYYKKVGDRVKAFRFLKMAAIIYPATIDLDIQNKIKALKIGIKEKNIQLSDIFETFLQYKQFADSELLELIQKERR